VRVCIPELAIEINNISRGIPANFYVRNFVRSRGISKIILKLKFLLEEEGSSNG
jgi:hypothetical protein